MRAVLATAARSLSGSMGTLGSVCTEMVIELPDVIRNVYPSAGAFATASAAIIPVAPGLFSTTTGCLSASARPGARALPMTSGELPGGKPTTSLIGLVGQSAPAATAVAGIVATAAN